MTEDPRDPSEYGGDTAPGTMDPGPQPAPECDGDEADVPAPETEDDSAFGGGASGGDASGGGG